MPISKVFEPKLISGYLPSDAEYDADIIILTMGRLKETCDAVASAQRQKAVTSHITLLDQGSPSEIIGTWIEIFRDYKNFCFFSSDLNIGVGAGRNFISEIGHGKIIVTLDNDAVFENDFVVAEAKKCFDQNQKLGALCFKILTNDGIFLDDFSWGYPKSLKKYASNKFLTTTFVGAGHAIRRVTWSNVGGYDPRFFFTWEEYDFCLRAICKHWQVEYNGNLAILHKVSVESRVNWNTNRAKYYVRNRLIISRKWSSSWFNLLPLAVGYLFKGLVSKCFKATILGVIEAVRYDRNIEKMKMPPLMSNYISQHEQSYRGRIIQRIKNEALTKFI